ncbi:MAG: hypothetical protein ACJ8FZ_08175 [Bradyrhizobium sp.]
MSPALHRPQIKALERYPPPVVFIDAAIDQGIAMRATCEQPCAGASARNKSKIGKLCQAPPSGGRERKRMKRILLMGLALFVSMFAMTMSASARLGIDPMTAQNDSFIQVKGGHGRGRGHMHRGGRGHHYGWYRGRGHHYGWRRHHRYFY